MMSIVLMYDKIAQREKCCTCGVSLVQGALTRIVFEKLSVSN